MYKENIPIRLKEARKKTGFTQREVAKETELSYVDIARYETGTRTPNVENLAILADFYNVTTDWLLGIGRKTEEQEIQEIKNRKLILKEIEKEAKQEKKVK